MVLGPNSESDQTVTVTKPTVMCMVTDISQERTASYIPTKGIKACRKTKQTDSYTHEHNRDEYSDSDDITSV